MNKPLIISRYNIDSFPKLQRYWEILNETEKEFSFDAEGLWSYTPQTVAAEVASHIRDNHIVDLFCGAGGNSIGFAKAGKTVDAVDISRHRIEMAKHNSVKIGVSDKINFHNTDALLFLSKLQSVGTVFLDPPWGGEKHLQVEQFSFDHFLLDVKGILSTCFKVSKHIILKLPFNFNKNDLIVFDKNVKIVDHFLPCYSPNRAFFLTAHFSTDSGGSEQ